MYTYKNVNLFLDDFKANKIDFPLKRIYYDDKKIKKMFNNLKKVKFDDRVFNKYYKINNIKLNTNNLLFLNRPTILISTKTDYHDFSVLSDMFQEYNRMKCKFFSAISSPLDYYNKNIETLAKNTLKNNKVITPHNLREELYNSVKECSSFKSINMIYLVKLFNAKSVLDPSSGWGDRLIAAMSCNIRYVGVDPNILLHTKYKEMIKFFFTKK